MLYRQDEAPPVYEQGTIFWNVVAARYYYSVTGQFVSNSIVREILDASLAGNADAISKLAALVSSNQISPETWLSAFQQQIKMEYLRQYGLGVGGFGRMGASEYGQVGRMLKDQYAFARDFMGDLAGLSEAQIRVRMELYISSARQAYEKGNATALGIPGDGVPFWPGDGSSECGANDACQWRWNPIFDENGVLIYWEGYWDLDPGVSEHCATCLERNSNSPFIIEVASTERVLAYIVDHDQSYVIGKDIARV